jgi:hypothetical protein
MIAASYEPFSLWQSEGLGYPVFLVDGAWHPLTLLIQPFGPAGVIAGTVIAAMAAAACLQALIGPALSFRARLLLTVLTAIVLAFQVYGTALVACGIASSLLAIKRYIVTPSRNRWIVAAIVLAFSLLAAGAANVAAWLIVPLGAAWSLAASTRRRAEAAVGVVALFALAAMLAAPWWIEVTAAGRERAPSTIGQGTIADDGLDRVLDLRRSGPNPFNSRRLASLCWKVVTPANTWSLGSPIIGQLGIRRVMGVVRVVPAGFRRLQGNVLESVVVLPRFFFTTSYVDSSNRRMNLPSPQDFRENGTVHGIPEQVVQLNRGSIAEGQMVLHGEGGPVRSRRVADGRFVVDVDSHGWNLLSSTEPWWEGWRVYRNGQRLPPMIVNGAFVGVFLPPGPATIVFRYRPAGCDAEVCACVVGLLLVLLTAFWYWPAVAAPVASGLVLAILDRQVAGPEWTPREISPQVPGADRIPTVSPWMFALARGVTSSRARTALLILLLAGYGAVLMARRQTVAGGADSSGYLSEARLMCKGNLVVPLPLAVQLAVPADRQRDVIPLGFAPGRERNTMVPTYPFGVPMEMALLRIFGDSGPFFLSPLSALAALVLLYRLARDLGSPPPWAAGGAAILALCPVFVFQGLQAMSDVVATFWAIAAIACAFRGAQRVGFAALAGACLGIGVLVRPTQLLLLPALLLAIGWRPRSLSALVAGGLPFAIAQLALARQLYGHPLTTGYGAAGSLVSWSFFAERFPHYSFWLAALLSPVVFPFGLLAFGSRSLTTRARAVLAAWFLPFFAFYCFYMPYETWWYTRFLLPAIPSLILATLLFLRAKSVEPARPWRRMAIAGLLAAGLFLQAAIIHGFAVLSVADSQEANLESARLAETRVPAGGVMVAHQQSGAIFYYLGRTSLRDDSITPGLFDAYRVKAAAKGLRFYALVAERELPELLAHTTGTWVPLAKARDVLLLELEPAAAMPPPPRASVSSGLKPCCGNDLPPFAMRISQVRVTGPTGHDRGKDVHGATPQ